MDCGALSLAKDMGVGIKINQVREDNEFSWGYIVEAPSLRIISITQELGVVQLQDSDKLDNYPIGKRMKIITHHSCLTAACFPKYSIMKNDEIIDTWETCPRMW